MLIETAKGGRAETFGAATGSSTGTTVTADATAHTKGTYAQLIAASARRHHAIAVSVAMVASSTEASNGLLDLAVGTTVVLADIPFCFTNPSSTTARPSQFGTGIPLIIPAGSQLQGRIQASSTNAPSVRLIAYGLGAWHNASIGKMRSRTYGASTTTSRGTAIDPGGTANTKGSWVQLSASIAVPMRAFMVVVTQEAVALGTNSEWLIDVGVGAAASEIVVASNLPAWRGNSRIMSPWMHGPFYLPSAVPASTRLAVRAQSATNNATNRIIEVAVVALG